MTTDQFLTVEKSSAECVAHNEANKGSIELGLDMPWRPSERALRDEKVNLERQRTKDAAKAIFQFIDPKVKMLDSYGSFSADTLGVRSEIKAENGGYGSSVRGWRITVSPSSCSWGRDSGKKWMKIGEGANLCLTIQQQEKLKALVAEVVQTKSLKENRRKESDAADARRCALRKAEPELLKAIGDEYGSKVSVHEDGRMSFNYETFTLPQWREIAALILNQKADMDALKQSFKP